MPFTSVPGAEIYWKLEGSDGKRTLVLLNSIGTDMDLWDELLPALREHFLLLRIDTRGHGASRAEPSDFSLAMLADDVLAVARDAGIAAFDLAGVSLGGMVGMEVALAEPTRVERLALVCTSATMDPTTWNERIVSVRSLGMGAIADLAMGRFLSDDFRAANLALPDTLRRQLVAMDPEGYAGCAAAIRDMNLSSRLGAIACPTLIVTGTRDISTPLMGHGEHLLAAIPEARHHELDAAHLAPIEAPDALARVLLSFLQE